MSKAFSAEKEIFINCAKLCEIFIGVYLKFAKNLYLNENRFIKQLKLGMLNTLNKETFN